MDDPLVQIVTSTGKVYFIEGEIGEIREQLQFGLWLSATNHPANEMFPPVPALIRIEEIESVIEESPEAWAFQRQIETDHYAKYIQRQDEDGV